MPAADHMIFDELMPHEITVYKTNGTNDYGKLEHRSYGSTYRCLHDDTHTITRTQEGEQVAVSRTTYINTNGTSISNKDKIIFADGSTRPVVNISHHYDADGAVHSVTVQFT